MGTADENTNNQENSDINQNIENSENNDSSSSDQIPSGNSGMIPTGNTGIQKKMNAACTNCRKAHKACSGGRPCHRCLKLGLPHLCTSYERKKRKPMQRKWFNFSVTNTEDGTKMQMLQMAPMNEDSEIVPQQDMNGMNNNDNNQNPLNFFQRPVAQQNPQQFVPYTFEHQQTQTPMNQHQTFNGQSHQIGQQQPMQFSNLQNQSANQFMNQMDNSGSSSSSSYQIAAPQNYFTSSSSAVAPQSQEPDNNQTMGQFSYYQKFSDFYEDNQPQPDMRTQNGMEQQPILHIQQPMPMQNAMPEPSHQLPFSQRQITDPFAYNNPQMTTTVPYHMNVALPPLMSNVSNLEDFGNINYQEVANFADQIAQSLPQSTVVYPYDQQQSFPIQMGMPMFPMMQDFNTQPFQRNTNAAQFPTSQPISGQNFQSPQQSLTLPSFRQFTQDLSPHPSNQNTNDTSYNGQQ